MSDTFTKVQDIIVEKLGRDKSEVVETANFVNDLGADSLDIVELVMDVEKVFDVEIPDERAGELQTVGDVVKYIEENKKN